MFNSFAEKRHKEEHRKLLIAGAYEAFFEIRDMAWNDELYAAPEMSGTRGTALALLLEQKRDEIMERVMVKLEKHYGI